MPIYRHVSIEMIEKVYKPSAIINPLFYTVSLWGGVVFFVIGQSTIEIMLPIAAATIIYAQVYSMISLYKCWSVLQGKTARTTPGRAVGFLFIPILNIYWTFVAIKGLAKDANSFLEQKNIMENKISENLSLAVSIASIIPYINIIVFPILINILIYQWANFFNHSAIFAENKNEASP